MPDPQSTQLDPWLDALLQLRKEFQESIASDETPLNAEATLAYNATLYHLQAAREEWKRTMRHKNQ